ncbi:hypothetical protein EHQ91_13195 [Leptospira biflexa]|uniref:hypothetical protein n=1 Tax=Leptospira biflexa TaxID=172 RepID=UPI0010911484|nr:hypothetical protein [Leptospira biflexa]TGM55842.1 hypothetical protein EHQ91_13195 [Leptospira biflexa]
MDPIKFNYISNSTDRYFNKLGNWINVSYKNFSGFVFSSEVRPYIDYCSEFPGINKPIKQSNIGDIINVYSDEIDYDHSYGDYSALIIDENDESILIFIRKVYICGEAYNKFSLGKVLDIKKGPKIERFSNYSDNVRNHDCSNKENDPILVFWKNSPLDFEIQSTFHIDLKKEKIVELNSMNTVCKYECKTCND